MIWYARAPRSQPRSRYRHRNGGAGVELAMRVVHADLDAERQHRAVAGGLHVLRRELRARVDLLDDAVESDARRRFGAHVEPRADGDAAKLFLRDVDPHVRVAGFVDR